ncbi:hypothetical protein [Nocardioides hwasunensis]|uniref:Uncharacterized protein n=1 Tax=Nocardioides hwasunensis TaxID=397258 RepID=A0ABR8MBG8_9ACTN|nr:hypothetical protein [Nocardioides hwasunensis]MBD3913490.1 hypothetical protein [Nocardioides hwasunensis]
MVLKGIAGVVATLAVAAVLGVVVLLASILGPQFPTEGHFPDLPDDYSYAGEADRGCGSGGCFLSLAVDSPDDAETGSLADALALRADDCRANGLLDRRKRCTGVSSDADGDVVISVMIHDLGK